MSSQTPPPFKSPYGPPGVPVDTRKLIHFQTDGVTPPTALYVDANDFLFVNLTTSNTGATFSLRYRILQPNGEILQGEFDLVPTVAVRQTQTFQFQLAEGFLLTAQFGQSGGGAQRGSTRARVFILRGASFLSYALMQGYSDNFFDLSWPPGIQEPTASGAGFIRSIVGTTPAAGANIVETVPTNVRWKIRSFHFTLTTNATVANRAVDIQIDDGVNLLYRAEAASVQPASTVRGYNYGSIGARLDVVVGLELDVPLPHDLTLLTGWRIQSFSGALQAGDQYSAPTYSVEEWISL